VVLRHLLTFLCTTLLALSLVFSVATHAVEPANSQLGPFYITPTLDLETRYTDNLFRSKTDEKDTWILDTLPKVQAWLQNGNSTYSTSAQLHDFRYASSHDDDFTDYQANIDVDHEFDARNTLEAFGQWYNGHEARGTGLTEGPAGERIDSPVELETIDYGAKYVLGSEITAARLEAGYGYFDRSYQNYKEATRFRDYDQNRLDATGYYALSPRTEVLAEVRYLETRYDSSNNLDPSGSFDSDEYSYFLGLAWDATAKTSGSVKLGWFDREYQSSARKQDDGFSWEVDVFYEPRSYSVFNFETKRFTQETNGLGDAINTQQYALRWDHDWSIRSLTQIEITKAIDEYSGSTRDDDRWFAEARYSYRFKRWFDLSGGYRFEKRDSSNAQIDYSKNVVFLSVALSL